MHTKPAAKAITFILMLALFVPESMAHANQNTAKIIPVITGLLLSPASVIIEKNALILTL